jgi:hypothetical protein
VRLGDREEVNQTYQRTQVAALVLQEFPHSFAIGLKSRWIILLLPRCKVVFFPFAGLLINSIL